MKHYLYSTIDKSESFKDNISDREKVPYSTYILILFMISAIFNKFKYGVSMSGVIPFIVLYIFILGIEKKQIKISKSHMIILLFGVCTLLSTVLSDVVKPQRNIITFLIFVVFYIFSTAISYNKYELRLILTSYIWISFFSSLNIMWNFINKFEYGSHRYSLYVFGIYRDPNYVSAFIVPAIGIISYIILFGNITSIVRKTLYYCVFLTLLIGILLTGSRAAFVVTVLSLIINFFFYFNRHYKKIKRVFYILLVVSIIFIISWFILKNILPYSIMRRLINFQNYFDDVRIKLWIQAMELFKRYPILGAGMESTNVYLTGLGRHNTHNVYVDILVGHGIIGMLLLSLIFVRFITVKRLDRPFMIMLVFSSFGPLFFINGFNTTTFWLPMILCEICSNFSRKSSDGISAIIKLMK